MQLKGTKGALPSVREHLARAAVYLPSNGQSTVKPSKGAVSAALALGVVPPNNGSAVAAPASSTGCAICPAARRPASPPVTRRRRINEYRHCLQTFYD